MVILKVGVKYSVITQFPITNGQLLIELWSVIGIGIAIGYLEGVRKNVQKKKTLGDNCEKLKGLAVTPVDRYFSLHQQNRLDIFRVKFPVRHGHGKD